MDFDPAYPEVFFLMVKWYWSAEELGQQLLEQYPTTHYLYFLRPLSPCPSPACLSCFLEGTF